MIELDWLKKWAQYSPTKMALKDMASGETWSYEDLYRQSQHLAAQFHLKYDIQVGDRVAVLAKNSAPYVVLFFALQRLGAIMVPINTRLATPEIDHILSDSEAKMLVADRELLDKHETLRKLHCLEMDGAKGLTSWLRTSEFSTWPFAAVEWSHPCKILYTSGTTGSPKGALITHQMLFWNSVTTTLRLNLSQDDRHVAFLPFFHTGGWNVLLTPFLHRGATTIILDKFDPDRVLEVSAQEKATLLFGVPTMMDMMARSPSFESCDLSSIRYAIVGGEPMPVPLIKTWQQKGIPVRQGFGLTEFGPNVFSLNEQDSLRKIGSIGFPNFYIDTRIVDADGNDVATNEVGELWLRGPMCTPGYWKNLDATAAAFHEGWLRTGDLVRCDSEGYFYVAGRKKDMFISGGENVYPPEIEQVLRRHPDVREAAVIGVPDSKWGEVGRAFVSLKAPTSIAGEDLLAFCSQHLARFKVPKSVVFLEDLPKGDSGKILKRALPASLKTDTINALAND